MSRPRAGGRSVDRRPIDPTLAERVARVVSLLRRARRHLLGGLVALALGMSLAAWATVAAKRTYASECSIFVRAIPGREEREASDAGARRSARLRDMLQESTRLEATIRKFDLYRDVVDTRGMQDAIEAMRPHVGLRAREGGRNVVSFDLAETDGVDTRTLVRDVTQHLAQSLVDDWAGGGLHELSGELSFLERELASSNVEVDAAVKSVTTFLSLHPEFAVPAASPTQMLLAPKAIPSAAPTTAAGAPATLDPILAALYRERARLVTQRLVSPKSAPAPDVTREVAAARLEAAKKRFAEAEADRVFKATKLTPEHPDLKAAEAAVALASTDLARARSELAALEPQAPGAVAPDDPVAEVDAKIARRRAQLQVAAPAKAAEPAPAPPTDPQIALETEWQRSLRALGSVRSRYDELTKRFEAAQLALKSAQAGRDDLASIAEPAFRPLHPTTRRRLLTAVLGSASALAIAILYVLARLALDDRIYDSDDLEALAIGPVLCSLPEIGKGDDAITEALALANAAPDARAAPDALSLPSPVDDRRGDFPLRIVPVAAVPTSPEILAVVADDPSTTPAVRVLRHRLEVMHAEGCRTFLVSSPRDGDGKSTTAAQLALVLAESQRARVVLVEADLRHPTLAALLGFTPPEDAGFSDQLLRHMKGVDEPWTIVAVGASLHVLAERPGAQAFPRALHSPQFIALLGVLAELYDYVIVDGPSILGSGDANALETVVDGLLVVVRSGASTRTELRRAMRQIGTRKSMGTVLAGGPIALPA